MGWDGKRREISAAYQSITQWRDDAVMNSCKVNNEGEMSGLTMLVSLERENSGRELRSTVN